MGRGGGEGPGGCPRGIGGGGEGKYFCFRGRNSHQETLVPGQQGSGVLVSLKNHTLGVSFPWVRPICCIIARPSTQDSPYATLGHDAFGHNDYRHTLQESCCRMLSLRKLKGMGLAHQGPIARLPPEGSLSCDTHGGSPYLVGFAPS